MEQELKIKGHMKAMPCQTCVLRETRTCEAKLLLIKTFFLLNLIAIKHLIL